MRSQVWLMATVKTRHSMDIVPGQNIFLFYSVLPWIVSPSGDAIKSNVPGHYLRKYSINEVLKISWNYCIVFKDVYLVRDIKPPILFLPIFSTNFTQFEQLKKKTNFSLVQKWEKTVNVNNFEEFAGVSKYSWNHLKSRSKSMFVPN